MKRSSLNQSYRLVWNQARNCWMAVAENSRSKGKSSCGVSGAVASAVLAALGSLAGQNALAISADPCASGTNTISTAVSGSCDLSGGERLIVEASGNLSTADVVVGSNGGTNNITNAGTINGLGTVNVITNSGTVGVITNSGSIGGYGSAISNSGIATIGSIDNSGYMSSSSVAGIANGGTIGSIDNSGTLSGQYGITNASSGSISSIDNSGTISSTRFGISGAGTTDSVTNSGSIISANSEGVSNSGTMGAIDNSGFISGGANGISNSGTLGSITNSGSISAGSDTGILNDGTIDSITNSGTISAGDTGIGSTASISAISNSGFISGSDTGIANQGTIGAIDNSGSIGGYYTGIYNDGTIDTIDNSDLISSSGGSGIDNYGTIGAIDNSGSINAFYGPGVSTSGTIDSITNSGSISSVYDSGVANSGTVGAIDNSGSISGGSSGINNGTGGKNKFALMRERSVYAIDSITNSGFISGEYAGISNAGTIGAITNSSSIIGSSGSGIYSYGTIDSVDNSGSISGSYAGISNAGTIGAITNSSSIIGSSGSGIYSYGTIDSVDNSGSISGSYAGISNSGTIGSITNSGLIKGDTSSIYNQGEITDGITNTGTLSGTVILNGADLTVTGTTARIIGDIGQEESSSSSTISTFMAYVMNTVSSTMSGSGGTVQIGDNSGSASSTFTSEGNIYGVDAVNVMNNATFNLSNGVQIGNALNNAGKIFIDSSTSSGTASGHMATVNGDYSQNGVLSIGAVSNSNYGQLSVSGTATLEESASFDVDVKTINTLAAGQTLHDVLNAGTLAGVSADTLTVTDNSALLKFLAVQDVNAVHLEIEKDTTIQQAVEQVGFGPGTGLAGLLDQLTDACSTGGEQAFCSGPVKDLLDELNLATSNADVAKILAPALPLLQASSNKAIQSALSQINQIIGNFQTGGGSSGNGWLTQRKMWLKPLVSKIDQGSIGSSAGYKADTAGFVMGAEGSIDSSNRVGVALAYYSSDADGIVSTQTHRAKTTGYQLVTYGTSAYGETHLNWQFDVGTGNTKGRRIVGANVASSDYDNQTAHIGVGLSQAITISNDVTLTPLVNLDYTNLQDGSYTETGSGVLLSVGSRTTEQLVLSTGAKWMQALNPQLSFNAQGTVGYDLINETSGLTASIVGAPGSFFQTGIKTSAWVARMGLGWVYTPTETTSWSFNYDLGKRESYTDQTISLVFKWSF